MRDHKRRQIEHDLQVVLKQILGWFDGKDKVVGRQSRDSLTTMLNIVFS